tara:strand:+ start:7026 stop:7319 length:294 start_codon:yes stop_codon:yes gene_type:complete
MNEKQRIALIANAVAQGDNKLDPMLSNFMSDLKAEKLAEDLVIEHGLLEVSEKEVEDQVSEFASSEDKAEDEDDFDNDENLHDMKSVSPLMREIFQD